MTLVLWCLLETLNEPLRVFTHRIRVFSRDLNVATPTRLRIKVTKVSTLVERARSRRNYQ